MSGQVSFVELAFAPNLRLVGKVRVFAQDFYAEMLADEDVLSRLALATHELLENAVKYSIDGMSRIRIEYIPQEVGGRMVIRTWNRPKPEDLARLQNLIREIDTSHPDEVYQRLIERSSKRTVGSGLGLGRVRAEAEMTVRFEVESDLICVIAEAPIGVTRA